MEDFSVFKSRTQQESEGCHHSQCIPFIPPRQVSAMVPSVSNLISLNERYYSKSIFDEKTSVNEASRHAVSFNQEGGIIGKSLHNNYYKKFEDAPAHLRRKRIKDIDLRFSSTGLMSYCDYLRGKSSR